MLSEASVLVSALGSCSLQLSVADPRALRGLFPALPGSGSQGTQEVRSWQQGELGGTGHLTVGSWEGFLLEGPGHFFDPFPR